MEMCEVCGRFRSDYQLYGVKLCGDCKELSYKWIRYINTSVDLFVIKLLKEKANGL